MSSERSRKAERIRHVMETEGDSVERNARGFNEGRYESVARLEDYDAYKDRARAIKEDAIERLPELIEGVREAVEENGGTVYVADDAADANRYVRELARERAAETVVKSKSMTTEEIDLNEALAAEGCDVWETDLGEFVLQVADEAPSHLVAPAIHQSREEIAALFNEYFEPEKELETAEELTAFARKYLGERIEDADVGVTGANFVTADTGTMALVTSEGNARKTVAVPDTHVAVAGVEKIVPTFEDLQPFVELIARSGTGQDITSYVSLFSPPVSTPPVGFDDDDDEPIADDPAERDFHLVLLDNGRMDMRDDDQLRETLYCIRCSACANSCANFQSVGGHVFGGETYSGGIATGWEAGVHGQESADEFNDLCTGCSRCVNQCPVKIDIPWINTVVRDRRNRGAEDGELDFLVEGLTPDEEPAGLDLQKRFFGNFSTLAKLGSATAPVSNWIADTLPSRALMERVIGVDRRRDLPRFERETFVEWFRNRDEPRPVDADYHAVVYPDLYTNYIRTDRGKATVRTLEALGVAVEVPETASSGRAPLSQGMIATAEDHARDVVADLGPYLEAGYDIVAIEPSDLAMFRGEYERLLETDRYEALSERSYEVFEYVYGLLENGADPASLRDADDGRDVGSALAYHSHCQQRTLELEAYTTDVLERLGYDVLTSDVECCGMAGSFGYKSEYYELSADVGDRLREQFKAPEAADRTVVASGTSCLEQLDGLLARRPRHPISLVVPDESE